MIRLLSVVAVIVALGIGLDARAQDPSTPVADASPNTLYCATPLTEAGGATPVSTIIAATPAASPGAIDPGTTVGLFACGTPDASPVGAASPAVEGSPTS